MKSKPNFLKWLLWMVLITTGLFIAEKSYEVLTYVFLYDRSKIGILLFILFWIMSIKCGHLIWKTESVETLFANGAFDPKYSAYLQKIELDITWIRHTINIATPMGFFGTVVGFIAINKELMTYNIESQAQLLIQGLGKGAFTALITTGVGLFVFILLWTQEEFLKKIILEKKRGRQ